MFVSFPTSYVEILIHEGGGIGWGFGRGLDQGQSPRDRIRALTMEIPQSSPAPSGDGRKDMTMQGQALDQQEGPHLTMLEPWPWTSSLPMCEK